ncbi:EamA family transporter RarD [Sneathiella chungangensis]|uniref:EamA family transporter RarD n=1 Tax=Sneathiella chungangensis TaxID=1418234 RepID=A0A845MMW2_9PROT|nr:EamA family transporter RarD [Sneathiella chungangensis]MZR24207.1 EamA family transporter RarD [Sneathiella chungangensis]
MTSEPPSSGNRPAAPFFSPDETRGLLSAFGAFIVWGWAPVYFKWLSHVSPMEVIAHRAIWSSVFVLLMVVMMRKVGQLIEIYRDPKKLSVFVLTTALIGGNWLTFIWAITNDRILEGSLGYYINPLVNILLGMLFLGERLNRWQTVSILLAIAAVTILTIQLGYLPWVSLVLAFSFGFYALLRKKVATDSAVGLVVETTLLFPLALGFLLYLTFTVDPAASGETGGGFLYDTGSFLLLIGTGVVTATPLILFTTAARYLKFTTIGVMQYLSPTMHVFIAVYIYNEPFDQSRLIAFGLIWLSLIIYSIDGYRGRRRPAAVKA